MATTNTLSISDGSQGIASKIASFSVCLIFLNIDFSFVDAIVKGKHNNKGRKGYSPGVLFKCILLAYLLRISIRFMVKKLHCQDNSQLREMLGLPLTPQGEHKIPHRTTFSKFIKRLGKKTFFLIFLHLVKELIKAGVISGITITADSTLFSAWCSLSRKKKTDTEAKWGCYQKVKGTLIWVFGYKLHLLLDLSSGLPVYFDVTTANRSEGKRLIGLLEGFKTLGRVVLYFISDSAYDYNINRKAIIDLFEAIAVIKVNPRNTKGKTEEAKKRRRWENLKKWYQKNNLLKFFLPPETGLFKELYRTRERIENLNNILQDAEQSSLNRLKMRGLEKATIHASMCLIAILTVALTAHRVGRPDLLLSIKSFTA